MMETARTCETTVYFDKAIWRYVYKKAAIVRMQRRFKLNLSTLYILHNLVLVFIAAT
jgi:hypothetical protein